MERITLVIIGLFFVSFYSNATEFDIRFLDGVDENKVLELINQDESILNKSTLADVKVNSVKKGTFWTIGIMHEGKEVPCIEEKFIASSGILKDNFKLIKLDNADFEYKTCVIIDKDYIKSQFSYSNSSLDISVPQAYLLSKDRNWVSPEEWSDGVSGAYLYYNYNFSNYDNNSYSYHDTNIILEGGASFGHYRIFSDGSIINNEPDLQNLYLYQDLYNKYSARVGYLKPQINSGLSIPSIYGVNIINDKLMLSPEERNYSATIDGFALSDSVLKIYKDEQLIYSKQIKSGPYSVDGSLLPSGQVTVELEGIDGNVTSYSAFNSSADFVLKPGVTRFSHAFGYDDDRDSVLVSGDAAYGIPNSILVGSTVFSEGVLAGGYNYIEGGFGVDLKQYGQVYIKGGLLNQTAVKGIDEHSNVLGVGYTSIFDRINGSLFIEYQCSDDGFVEYYNLADIEDSNQPDSAWLELAEQERITGSLTVSLFNTNFTMSGNYYQYEESKVSRMSLAASRGFRLSDSISLNASLSFERSELEDRISASTNNSIFITLDFPLGNEDTITTTYSRSNNSDSYGTYYNGRIDQLDYHASMNKSTSNKSAGFGVDYNSAYGIFSADYHQNDDHLITTRLGAEGTLISTSDVTTLTAPVRGTIALVGTNDEDDIYIGSSNRAPSSDFGYSSVMLSPYSNNVVALDENRMAANVSYTEEIYEIVPRKGSIHYVGFDDIKKGHNILISVLSPSVKIGSIVQDSNGVNLGFVDDDKEIYLSAFDDNQKSIYIVGDSNTCTIDIPSLVGDKNIYFIDSRCR